MIPTNQKPGAFNSDSSYFTIKMIWFYFVFLTVVFLLFVSAGSGCSLSGNSGDTETKVNLETSSNLNINSSPAVTSLTSPNQVEDSRTIIPQATPFLTLLKAVKSSDSKLLKTAFSNRMIKIFEEQFTWEEVLNEYKNVFRKQFGDYELDDFSFVFNPHPEAGNKTADESGMLKITFKGKSLGGMKVIRQTGSSDWKLDEK